MCEVTYPKSDDKDGYSISTILGNPSGFEGFASDTGVETALIIDGCYYILNGDWHEMYLACSDLDECKRLFNDKKSVCKSSWSEDFPESCN